MMSATVPGSTHRYVCSLLSGPSVLSRRDHLFPAQTGSVRFQKHCSCSGCWPGPTWQRRVRIQSEALGRILCISLSLREIVLGNEAVAHTCLPCTQCEADALPGQSVPRYHYLLKPRASSSWNADSFRGLACFPASIPAVADNSLEQEGPFPLHLQRLRLCEVVGTVSGRGRQEHIVATWPLETQPLCPMNTC